MDVAVIIPLYNGARWIRQTLLCAIQQTHPPAEILVVDDGSTDESCEIVKQFPRVRLERNPTKGANAARRFGASQTKSPLIAMLDQDDLWHRRHLFLQVNWMAHRDVCRAISSSEIDIDRKNPEPVWDLSDLNRRKNDAWENFPFGPRVGSPSAVMIRRSSLEEIGGWPTEFPGMADYYSWLGLSANGTPGGGMAISNARTMARRRHQYSYSANLRTGEALVTYSETLWRASLAAAERFGPLCSLDAETLAKRVELAGYLHKTLLAFSTRDWPAFAATTRASWEFLKGEPTGLRRKFGGMACWFFDGRRTRDDALNMFDQAIAHWPEEDVATIAILKRRRTIYAEWNNPKTA